MEKKNLIKNVSEYSHTKLTMKHILTFLLLLPLTLSSQVLTLEESISLASKNNFTVQLADYDVRIAEQKINELKANQQPKVSTAFDYRYYINLPYQLLPAGVFGGPPGAYKEAQFGVPHNININGQVTYPLHNPTLKAGIKTAEKGVEITGLQKTKSAEDVALDVANVYYNAQLLLNQEIFIDSNISNTTRLLKLTKLLHEQRVAKGTDVDKVTLQLFQLQTQKENVRNQYVQAINLLKFLTGKSPEDSIGVEVNPGLDNTILPDETIISEIKLAQYQIDFLQTEKKGIEKSRLPVINLTGLYGTTGFGKTGANDFLKFFPIGYAGVQVIFPIYNGGSVKQKLRSNGLEIQKANTRLEMIRGKNDVDKRNNYYQLVNSKNNLQVINTQIDYAKVIYDKTLLQQKEGIASLTDVLLADNVVREAQQNYISNLVTLRRAELEYRKITGNLLKSSTR